MESDLLFSTSPNSARMLNPAANLFDEIVKRFPETEGFKVSVSHWQANHLHYTVPEFRKRIRSITPHVGQRVAGCNCEGCRAL